MTTRITSPFGWDSTAAEVAQGHDLAGKRAIITGAISGIGLETARVLASCGAEVVLTGRNIEAAAPLIETIRATGGKADIVAVDLTDLVAVEDFAVSQAGKPLHLLINIAGIMGVPFGRTRQGFELQIGVNHLAHFHLTKLLLPALKAAGGARVVSLSSSGHHWGRLDLDDPFFERKPYQPLESYAQSKGANVLFAVELDRRYRSDGIRAFSVMPGGIRTNLARDMSEETKLQIGVDPEGAKAIKWKSVEQGSATTIWAAIGRELEGVGGLYLEDVAQALPHDGGKHSGVMDWATDPDLARQLWKWSEETIARARAIS